MNLIKLSLAAVAGLVLTAGASQAVSYDAVSTFAPPSGATPFSYGYRTAAPGSFTLFNATTPPSCAGIGGLVCGYNTALDINNLPAVGRNVSGATIMNDPAAPFVVLPTNVLFLHPVNTADAVVRFTAPVSGFYSVTGSFKILDGNATGVLADIRNGTASLLTFPLANTATPGGFNFGVFLTASSTLDFGVNAAGNYSYDSTGLQALISVPEPASMALLASGMFALGFVRRRNA